MNDSLFHGVAVVIDDEVNDPASPIAALVGHIRNNGCHVVTFDALPTEEQVRGMSGASFFILDWKLWGTLGVDLPAGLIASAIADNIQFIERLRAVRFAPVFVFTHESPDEVRGHLRDGKQLHAHEDLSNVFVEDKGVVTKAGVFSVLNDWLTRNPAAQVLKQWERAYERAKNNLFRDLYQTSALWPAHVWQCFSADGVDEPDELGRLIERNIASRMLGAYDFTEPKFPASVVLSAEDTRRELLAVMEAERFVANHSLSPAPTTGDLFKHKKSYFINIRPECDCVPRGCSVEKVKLYLIEGEELDGAGVEEAFERDFGNFKEQHNQAILFDVDGGKTLRLRLHKLTIDDWGTWKTRRVGRVLPPHLTRIQQRYASYLQRPGLSRVPAEAVGVAALVAAGQPAAVDVASVGAAEQPAAAEVAGPQSGVVSTAPAATGESTTVTPDAATTDGPPAGAEPTEAESAQVPAPEIAKG